MSAQIACPRCGRVTFPDKRGEQDICVDCLSELYHIAVTADEGSAETPLGRFRWSWMQETEKPRGW